MLTDSLCPFCGEPMQEGACSACDFAELPEVLEPLSDDDLYLLTVEV